MKEYELQLQESTSKIQYLENSSAQDAVSDLQSKIDRSQSEVNFLKQEINRYKRELEISQKSTIPNQTVAKNDAGTLSLAIKSFKSELADKEKDIIKLKKEIADLNRTNVSLKKERERYLMFNNTGHGNHPQRIVTRVQTATPMMGGGGAGRGKNLKDASNTSEL
jgi:chromosome segregation ATPase